MTQVTLLKADAITAIQADLERTVAGSASAADASSKDAARSAVQAGSQADIATTQAEQAAASADTATAQAGIATIQADIAITKAGQAETSAGTATSQAVIATTQAGFATTHSGQAATSAGTATTQAGIATDQAVLAASSAVTATTQAGIATTQAGNAALSAKAAAASYDRFDERYLGAKSNPPATDNDGNPLIVGALYWNTTSTMMMAWSGTEWIGSPSTVLIEQDARVLADQQLAGGLAFATDLAGQAARTLARKQDKAANLTAISALPFTDNNFIVGNGSTFVAESGATARTSLGLGDSSTRNVGTTAGTVSAGDHGHTGVYQPFDGDLTALAGLSTNGLIERTGSGTAEIVAITAAGKAILDDVNSTSQRTTLGAAAANDLIVEVDNRILYDEALTRAVAYATDLAGKASMVLSGSVPSQVPASAVAPGRPGQIAFDSSYIYVCTTSGAWKRAALSTW